MEKTENQTSIDLVYEEQLIRDLISDIIINCSYREKRKKLYAYGQTYREAHDEVVSLTNFNGDRIFENVCNFFATGGYRAGWGVEFVFQANELCSPQLVTFLIDMISGEKVDYNWFINREELKKKEELESKIKQLDEEINVISNFQMELKIKKLTDLAWYVDRLDSLNKMNFEKLSNYYDLAEQYISVGLAQETVGFQKKLTPPKQNNQ